MIVSRLCTVHPQLTPLTLDGTVMKVSDDLVYWSRLMLRWPLRSTFTLFPVLLLRGLVSWDSPGKYFMIGLSYWDLIGALTRRSWSNFQQCCARLLIHSLYYWADLLGVLFFRYFWLQPCPSFVPPHCKTSQNYRTFVPLSVSLWNDFGDPVFDGVGLEGFKSRANACFPVGLICSFILSPTIFSCSSFHGLVVWGIRIDSVLALTGPFTADSILIIITQFLVNYWVGCHASWHLPRFKSFLDVNRIDISPSNC